MQPLGKDALGLLFYHSNGRFAMQISRHDRPVLTTDYFDDVAPDELKLALNGYFAYFGTYEVDERKNTVTHSVEGSLFPNWVGTDQVRRYELSKNRLTLEKPVRREGKERRTGAQVWKRLP